VPVPTSVIAEDDSAIRDLLSHHLETAGFVVVGVADGPTALRTARSGTDLIILDIGLPGIDGFDVARMLRREGSPTPIIFLTARGDEVDRVVGFELGADDYSVKPFSVREAVARTRAVLARSGRGLNAEPVRLQFGRLEVDEAAREARVDGRDVGLKPREFGLLLELALNAGVALSRAQLLQRVWGMDFPGDERTVDVHVRRLRKRVEEGWRLRPFIVTVRGYGYKLARR
jgi:DNA-binding response OmpR family regulator